MSSVPNLCQRLLKVYNEVQSIEKTGEIEAGQGRSYTVVTYDTVVAALHLPLAKHGIVVWPTQKSCTTSSFEKKTVYNGQEKSTLWYRADVTVETAFINADDPTDRLVTESTAFALDTGDKAIGKAYTLALKAVYLKVFLLESQDQEEARAFEEGTAYREKPNYSKPQPQAPQQKPKNFTPVTPAEIKKLLELAETRGIKGEDFKEFMQSNFHIASSKEMTKDQFELAMDVIKRIREIPDEVNL